MVDSYVGAFRNGNINVIRGLLFRGINANGRFGRRWVNTRTGEVQSVQVGIDPGWNHNTGVMGSTQKLSRMADRLDEPALDPGLARSMVREGVRDTAFLDFLSGAVAVAPRALLDRIGSRSRTVRLQSGDLDEGGRTWQASIIAADDEDGNRRTYLGSLGRR